MQDNGEVVSESDSNHSMLSLEDASDDGVEYAVERKSLLTKCALNS